MVRSLNPGLRLETPHPGSYTEGNPRLLKLFTVLYQRQTTDDQDQAAADALASLAANHSLEFLLRRIWQHLNDAERYVLEILAVFRSAVSETGWADVDEQTALKQLQTWGLLRGDSQGGLRTLGEIRLRQEAYTEAEQLITHSIDVAQANQDKFLEGYGQRALAEVYLAQNKTEPYQKALQQAIESFQALGLSEEVEKTRQIGRKGLAPD